MPYIIEVRTPVDENNYHAVDGPWSDAWHDIGEGPFESREEAEEYAAAEVGLPYRIVPQAS
jgi:hypothetical protein